MIKNIIFDIGNVLAEFRWKAFIEEIGIPEEFRQRVAEATVLSPTWNEIDRGVWTEEEVIEGCRRNAPEITGYIDLFFKDRRRLVMEYPYAAEWIDGLKAQGYKVYLLSNYSENNFHYIHDTFKFFGHEDGSVISYQEKVIKPDRRIYDILLERYNLKAEECVFLDDSERNIAAALAIGMKGIVVKNYEQANSELKSILADR